MSDATERGAPRLCSVCSDPVDPAVEHWLHEPGCPVQVLADADHVPGALEVRDALDRCGCDLVAHPDCCPQPDCTEVRS